MIQLMIDASKIEFVAFTPHLVVPRHLIAWARVMKHAPEYSGHDYIEVGLVTGGSARSESGVSDIPAYIRRQLGIEIG